PTSCLSDPKNRQTNPIYEVLVIYAGGSPPAISTQNHQNNYGQALYAVQNAPLCDHPIDKLQKIC
ncbi:MAG: hypothetical protein SH821_08950, partial [Phototrophicales bacterium]|nr:hypothetical protein [Phototrophicales bacterium]